MKKEQKRKKRNRSKENLTEKCEKMLGLITHQQESGVHIESNCKERLSTMQLHDAHDRTRNDLAGSSIPLQHSCRQNYQIACDQASSSEEVRPLEPMH